MQKSHFPPTTFAHNLRWYIMQYRFPLKAQKARGAPICHGEVLKKKEKGGKRKKKKKSRKKRGKAAKKEKEKREREKKKRGKRNKI